MLNNVSVSFLLLLWLYSFLICNFLLILELRIRKKKKSFYLANVYTYLRNLIMKNNSTGGSQELLSFILLRLEQSYCTWIPTSSLGKPEPLPGGSAAVLRSELRLTGDRGPGGTAGYSCVFCLAPTLWLRPTFSSEGPAALG